MLSLVLIIYSFQDERDDDGDNYDVIEISDENYGVRKDDNIDK